VLSSSGVSVDEEAQEYRGGFVIVSWSAISGSGLPDSGSDGARAADGDGCASFGLSGTGNGI